MARDTVLVVEDEPQIRALAIETLLDAGYTVLEADSGSQAILMFEQHPEIAVVFTDIVMSGIDGFKLADMVKVLRPAVKILYATGFAHRARDYLGVVHGPILHKPYRQMELAAAIATTLRVAVPL